MGLDSVSVLMANVCTDCDNQSKSWTSVTDLQRSASRCSSEAAPNTANPEKRRTKSRLSAGRDRE